MNNDSTSYDTFTSSNGKDERQNTLFGTFCVHWQNICFYIKLPNNPVSL